MLTEPSPNEQKATLAKLPKQERWSFTVDWTYAQQRLHWQVKVLEGLAVVKESLKKVATIQQNNLKKQLPSLGTSKVT